MKTLRVNLGERSYPIFIDEHILENTAEFLKEKVRHDQRLFVVTDEHVAPLYLQPVLNSLEQAGYTVGHYIVEAGEKAKSLDVLQEIIGVAIQSGLDRNSLFLALGGGVVGDLTGFVAATYMRGVEFIQLPTTLLAHDSSVGGKVGVNHPLGKNMIGAFHQPLMVIYDTHTLKSLPVREVSAGFAEVIKHGLIWDASFVSWLESHAEGLLRLEPDLMKQALYRACSVKVNVVSQDEKEQGLRAILNLGHTFGHAIESLSGYSGFIHGEAVSVGMVGASLLAERLGMAEHVFEPTRRLLKRYRLPVRLPDTFDEQEMLDVMKRDKKSKEGKLVMVLPEAIGRVQVVKGVDETLVMEALKQLKEVE
ncbi:MAG: 3-dehydroquinate synthase [Bacillaceae bacterium]|nr:3-dehydroquinate synthase [Bacillaceae bacterium]